MSAHSTCLEKCGLIIVKLSICRICIPSCSLLQWSVFSLIARSITCTICLPIMHTYSICLEKCTIIIVRLSIEWICSPSYSLDIISFWCHEVHTLHGFFSAHSKISISWNKCGAYHKLVPAFCERDMLSWGRWMFELCRWMCCQSWIFHNLHLRFMQFAALHYRSVEWSPCPFDIPSHWEIVKTRSDLCSVEWASTITRHCQPDTWYDTKMSNGHWKSVEFTWSTRHFNVEWTPFLWLCMNPTTKPVHYKSRMLTFLWKILKSHLVFVVRNSSLP
jgi:hypothetical protein